MAGTNGLRMALGAAAAVTILGVAVVLEPLLRQQVADPVVDPVAIAVPADALLEDVAAIQDSDVVVSESAPAVDPVPEPSPDLAPPDPTPVIDVVRIAPDGTGIVAGRAVAGAAVSVMLDDLLVAQAVADATGSFAAFVTLPPSDQPRTLSLIADPAGAAVGSDATVIVAPSPKPEPAPEVIALAEVVPELPETGQEAVPESEIEQKPVNPVEAEPTEVAPDTPSPTATETQQTAPAGPVALTETVAPETVAPEIVATPPAQTEAPAQTEMSVSEPPSAALPDPAPELTDTVEALQQPVPDAPGVAPVLRMDEAGVRVLQPAIAPGATPEVLATVALDAIAYDAAGDVQLSGRAAGGGTVRIYVDSRPVIDVPVGADGQWASGLPDVPTGVYTMRVDQLDAGGAVVSRIETPFLREERATIAAAMVDQTEAADFTVAVKTVQPGATLWAIARERYGDGVMYVQVFEANRDRIRNPDLIYPGQVFVLPEIEN